MTRREAYEEWLREGAPGMSSQGAAVMREWLETAGIHSSEGGRDVIGDVKADRPSDPAVNAFHADALEGFAAELRESSRVLISDGELSALESERLIGYEVAAALNEVAAALLRCA